MACAKVGTSEESASELVQQLWRDGCRPVSSDMRAGVQSGDGV